MSTQHLPGPEAPAVDVNLGASPLTQPAAARGRSWPSPAQLATRFGLIVVWAAMIVVFSVMRPATFATTGNFTSIFNSQAILLLLSLGLVVSLVTGDFNLALPGVFSTCLMVIGVLNGNHHMPWGVAVFVALGVSAILGGIHAWLIVGLGLSSFIVTLGTGSALLGVGYAISEQTISTLSSHYGKVITEPLFGLEVAFYVAIVAVIVLWYVYRFTPTGRRLYFVGASQEVAALAGVSVARLRSWSIVVSCMFAGLAAVVAAGYLGSTDPGLGSSFLLPMFASTLLGSTAITPGRPNPWGTAIAAYFLVTGYAGLQLLGLNGWIVQVFYGSALVVAVAVATLTARRLGGEEFRFANL
jgi:ribose transport system permease protein